jgi:hypothetical protein
MKVSAEITIPTKLRHDRAIKRLLVAWCNAHARFHVCAKRVNWRQPGLKSLEKKRRKEKWVCVAKILDIEHTVLRWIGQATHHPDLWVKPSSEAYPRRNVLRHAYYRQREHEHNLRGDLRKKTLANREAIVAEIRALDRTWMLALLAAVYPEQRPPRPLVLHPRELLPRKILRASKALTRELEPPQPSEAP